MSELSKATAKLLAAYERLAHGNNINSGAEFAAYCERWGLDHAAMMSEAHARIDAELAERRQRRERFEQSKRAYAAGTGATASRANSRKRGAIPEFWSWWGDRLANYPTLNEANAAYRALFGKRVQS